MNLVEKVQTLEIETPSPQGAFPRRLLATCKARSSSSSSTNTSKLKSGPPVKVTFVQIKAVFVKRFQNLFFVF